MAMGHGFVLMVMRMGARNRWFVNMRVMVNPPFFFITMGMWVGMRQHFMAVRVGVVFGQVQPDSQGHETSSNQQLPRHGFSKKQH